MPKHSAAAPTNMIDRMALAIATADGQPIPGDPSRYRRLALAALKPLAVPTDAMIDAAHNSVWFDAEWAINTRQDFQRAVRAMVAHALAEG